MAHAAFPVRLSGPLEEPKTFEIHEAWVPRNNPRKIVWSSPRNDARRLIQGEADPVTHLIFGRNRDEIVFPGHVRDSDQWFKPLTADEKAVVLLLASQSVLEVEQDDQALTPAKRAATTRLLRRLGFRRGAVECAGLH